MHFINDLNANISLVVALSCLALLGRELVKKWWSHTTSLPYPPGPRGGLVVGNMYDIPSMRPWLTYTDWAKKYGSIVHASYFGRHIIIVNKLHDAIELFEKRSNLYSDRVPVPMLDLMGWGFNTAFIRYGNRWRLHRRLYQRLFRKKIASAYHPVQIQKTHEMLRGLLSSPDQFMLHYRTCAAAIIMSTMYGHDIKPQDDHFIALAEQAVSKLSESVFPGAVAVNALPALRYLPSWFPGARFKRFAEGCKELTDEMQDMPLRFVKENMASGIETSAAATQLLSEHMARDGSKEDEDIIKAVASTSFAAGADTTVSALGTFFYAMCCNPQAQKRAQEEIDSVVGQHRLPDYNDRPSMPYVEAIYREVMRWKPAGPLGVSHSATEDGIYNGYFIPKGAEIISNIWAMTHDESIYPQPDLFIPERYFDVNGDLNDDDLVIGFGFGRRVCPGRHMAGGTVWLTIVSVLSTFNISKAKDAGGNDIPIADDYSGGLVSHKLPFSCSITPRSEAAKALIDEI